MSMLAMLAAGATVPEIIYVDDVFSTYLYTGNGSTQTINNGIDLAGKGGLVWAKSRSAATDHKLTDTVRGVTKGLISDTTGAETTDTNGITTFNSTGFALGTDTNYNNNAATYASWTFRKAAKFFDVQTATVSGGVTATVDLSSLGTVGMVAVKRTDSTSNWFVYHRSCTSGKLVYLNLTDAETIDGSVTLSGTTLSLVGGTIANGTYIVYAWAHDTSAGGLIQCGSFTTNGSGNATVSLGWEPQWVMMKNASKVVDWVQLDSLRGWNASASDAFLASNSSAAEGSGSDKGTPTATGFNVAGGGLTDAYIYLAIRRPNKPPTSGTQVYAAQAGQLASGSAGQVYATSNFPVDFMMQHFQSGSNHVCQTRLTGDQRLLSNTTDAEATSNNPFLSNLGLAFPSTGYDTAARFYHMFKRAPGVLDIVCYPGTGANKTETHNLGVAPELWIIKGRSGATAWTVGCTSLANTEYLVTNTTATKATDATAWNSTFPTSMALSLGTQATVNTNTATYVAYLFATKAGISKVGSYPGNGSSQTIDCGFTTGARFVLIKRTDAVGDWFIWDTVRGIVAGNDPHLSLNTIAAEITTDDSIDPVSSGFIVNQLAATDINVTSATYIFLAFA